MKLVRRHGRRAVGARWFLGCIGALTVAAGSRAADAPLPVPCAACGGTSVGFVASGQAGYTVVGTNGTVTQSSDRAVLNWQSFNVAAGSTLEFVHPSSTAATLNRIFQADPSRIFGSLKANGQVFLVNQNGIVFGSGARVSTGALVASALDVPDDIFNTVGIAGAINLGDSSTGARPAFSGSVNEDVAVEVDVGASIGAADRIFLIAPRVVNRGSLTTAGGQAILAASTDKVYLASDRELRGFLVEVGTGGSVENLGSILAERGNVTLAGLAVNQSGRVRATTSVSVNGTVRLLARDGADPQLFEGETGSRRPVASRGGTLTFGPNSVTESVPDLGSDEQAVDLQAQLLPSLEAQGKTVEVRGNATLRAPGGRIELTATSTPNVPLGGSDATAQVFVGAGAILDVAGDDSTIVPMERNQATVRLFGNELADAPLQRDGPLARQDITVDLRRGTPLTDVSRLREDVLRGVGERLSTGGSIAIAAEGDVILQDGSSVDFSGGQVRYLDGTLETTKLIGLDGRVVDVSVASPDVRYLGIVGRPTPISTRWGAPPPYVAGQTADFEAGYFEGKDAGSLAITAGGRVALGATLHGEITAGRLQQRPATSSNTGLARPFDEVPWRGSLSVVSGAERAVFANDRPRVDSGFGSLLPAELPLTLSVPSIRSSGLNRIDVRAPSIVVPADVVLDLPGSGALALSGNSVLIDGDIRSPGGRVAVLAQQTVEAPGRIEVGAGGSVDLSGAWVNDLPLLNGGGAGTSARFVNGGSLALTSSGDVVLQRGSVLDVSAGARATGTGTPVYGKAGSIVLASRPSAVETDPRLHLDGSLRGFGFDAGGSISLEAAGFVFSDEPAGEPSDTVVLSPSFFNDSGFGSVALLADRRSITVERNVAVDLNPRLLVLDRAYATQPTGSDLRAFSAEGDPAIEALTRPTSFSATLARSAGVQEAAVLLDVGSSVQTTTGGSIFLSSDADLRVLGTVRAPGGNVSLQMTPPSGINELGYDARQGIRVGGSGVLDVAGRAQQLVDERGFVSGTVAAGGTVALDALRGYVILDSGSKLDVSGAAADFDVPGPAGIPVRTTVTSGAGTIRIRAAEGVFPFGDLVGRPGGPTAVGGTFALTLDASRSDPNSIGGNPGGFPQFPTGQRTILVGADYAGAIADGTPVPAVLAGTALVPTTRLKAGGFDAVELAAAPLVRLGAPLSAGTIRFDGDVVLSADRRVSLDAASLSSTGGSGAVRAPYVALGPTSSAFTNSSPPAAGLGRLDVEAGFIDVRGTLVLDAFASSTDAPAVQFRSTGDIRLTGALNPGALQDSARGSLSSGASLLFRSAQLYPSTLTSYSLAVLGDGGTIRFESAGSTAAAPLSVAGSVVVAADRIEQNGVVRAPFGELTLRAASSFRAGAGSLTSVKSETTTPFGVTEFQQDWVYPLGNFTLVLDGTPEKLVSIDAPDIDIASGAVVDLSGGGDLLSYEFVPGPGGSRDILTASNAEGSFAVLPAAGLYGAYDPYESAGFAFGPGRTVVVGPGSPLPEGEYAVLPARYALLPGAYLLRPTSAAASPVRVAPSTLADGVTPVIAGRLAWAGSDAADSLWSTFAVLDQDAVRARSEYVESTASAFFLARNAGTPADAGRLVLAAQRAIALDGSLVAGSGGGRGAEVDFVAERLAIVRARSGNPSRVEIVDRELQRFGAASIVLGGTRRARAPANEDDLPGVFVETIARTIGFESGVSLRAPELIAVATNSIRVSEGATLGTAAGTGTVAGSIATRGDGALLRVAAGPLVEVTRSAAPGTIGDIAVDAGASLIGERGAITLESSRSLDLRGSVRATGGAVELATSRVGLGSVPAQATGLSLTNEQISAIEAAELRIRSRSLLAFHGDVTVRLDRVGLDAAELRGVAAAGVGPRVLVDAREILLGNSAATVPAAPAPSLGELELLADRVTIVGGEMAVTGFERVSLAALSSLHAEADSRLTFAGDLTLQSSQITAATATELSIDGARAVVVRAGAAVEGGPPSSLASTIRLAGASVDFGGRIVAPAGTVSLASSGSNALVVRSDALIDLSGADLEFAGTAIGAPGGVLSIASGAAVIIEDRATLAVAGGTAGGAGGLIDISSAGSLSIGSGVRLHGAGGAGSRQGSFVAVAGDLAGGFSALNSSLNAGGFTARRAITLTAGNLEVAAGDVVSASDVRLSAEGGIDVRGRIDAFGSTGGSVGIYAGRDLTLHSSAVVDARGTTGAGGFVELASRSGSVALGAASIDVGGRDARGAPEDSGVVRVRAPRTPFGVAVPVLAASIVGTNRVDVEGFRSYAASFVDAALIGLVRADTQAYMATWGGRPIGGSTDARVRLVAGVEVASAGDLTVAAPWDLVDWRYAGSAGVLTLRAANDVRLSASVTDGVRQRSLDGVVPPRDVVDDAESWSIRLAAGAGPGGGPLDVRRGSGSVIVADGAVVRTGTGRIDLSAGADLVLSGSTSAVYTVGANRGTGELDPLDVDILMRGDFLWRGGDVVVQVGRDVVGSESGALPDWQPRLAGEYFFYRPGTVFPAAWAIDVSKFKQGIAALGGGTLIVDAGRDITALTAAVPTNARAASSGGPLEVEGHGRLHVSARRDIRGGVFHVGAGSATLDSDGAIGARATGLAPVFVGADASFQVNARRGISYETYFNSTVAEPDPTQGLAEYFFFPVPAYFFTYSDRSALALQSVAGAVEVRGDGSSIAASYFDRIVDPQTLAVLPGTLRAQSLAGDVVVASRVDLFPAARGALELIAGGDVTARGSGSILLSNGDVSQLPSPATPAGFLTGAAIRRALDGNAPSPVHSGDSAPVRITAQAGSVGATGLDVLRITTAKQARVSAGKDIENFSLTVMHVTEGDVTVLEARRDILFSASRRIDGALAANSGRFDVAGPGRVELLAGRTIDFGAAVGLLTRGDLAYPVLPDLGASVGLWTGRATPPDIEAFTQRYLADTDAYSGELAEYLAAFPGTPGANDVERFGNLPYFRQLPFVADVFFAELKVGGLADFDAGFAAIETLFPTDEADSDRYSGDLRSFLSRISTLDGGGIDLVVPNGLVNAGVAATGRFSKPPSEIGIVAQGEGSVRGYVKQDFLVNASRVFALDGGDILIWSSEGDIDAGRGARSALSIPPPVVSFDPQGNVVVDFPAAISGSGIRTAVATPGRDPGDVFLFAPAGVVDAGDAGIASAGNVTINAVQVIGADNIQVGGVAIGVPVDSGALGVGLTAASASSAAAGGQVVDAGAAASESDTSPLADSAVAWLDVFVVGLGEENCKPDDLECLKRQKRSDQ